MIDPTASPLKILRWVEPKELLARTDLLRLVYESLEGNPLGLTIEHLLDDIYATQAILWTWGEGVLVTSIQGFPTGNALHVSHVRGKNYLVQLETIEADCVVIAKALGCKWLLGEVPSQALIKAYVARGATPFHFMLKEIPA